MPSRPYVLLSCATSADGYLDDATPRRLILSGPADLDRVDEVRAGCDAILVGAQTVRTDNPRLLIRDPRRSARRAARGLPAHPARVTLTATGDLDPRARFFAPGALRLVYCATPALTRARARLGDSAVLIDAGDPLSLDFILSDLAERGVARALVEGGAHVLGEFLAAGLADELNLAVAPFFVADPAAPRLDLPGPGSGGPMTLAETRRVGEVALLRYLLGAGGPDHRFLRWAVELSRLCPPSDSAFSVGAVVVGEDGEVLATGFSREQEDHDHAEEVALRKLARGQPGPDPRLRHATVYSSLVPCGARASRPVTCVGHIVAAGIPRVVFAWREPRLFTDGEGAEQLRAAGVAITELPELAERARAINAHLVRIRRVTSPGLRHSRIAILGYFFVLGAATATWAARLPAIKESLHLSDGRLGLALFAVPAGSVLTLALSGRIADRFGAVRVLRIAGVLVPVALVPIGLASGLAALMATLAVYGALAGLLDVSMNACGARLELGYDRPIMSSLHAGYSIAGLAGAGIGGIAAWLGASPLATFTVAAVALIVLSLMAAPHVFIPAVAVRQAHPDDPPRRSARQISAVIWVLGLLALCGQVGEGSAGDWSAVYMHANLGTSAGVAAVALGAFSVTMAAGRVAGDRLSVRFGPVRLVRASGLVAGLGLAAGLLIGTPAAAIVGFALLGLGLAGIFPQIVTAAARLDPEQAGRNIGRIAAVSYSGLLSGPVLIGVIASGVGLRAALGVPAALALLVAAAAGVMSPRR